MTSTRTWVLQGWGEQTVDALKYTYARLKTCRPNFWAQVLEDLEERDYFLRDCHDTYAQGPNSQEVCWVQARKL